MAEHCSIPWLSPPLDLSASPESVLDNIQARTKRRILEMATVIVSWFLYFYIFGLHGTCELIHCHIWYVVNETSVIRWNYGDPQLGSCKETIQGGNHFRYWVQNGPGGNRWSFLPSGLEYDVTDLILFELVVPFSWLYRMSCLSTVRLFSVFSPNLALIFFFSVSHDIIPNGYNLARLKHRILHGDLSC